MHQVAFYIGSWPIHWYGLAWGISFIWMRLAPVYTGCITQENKEQWYCFIDYGLLAAVVGGRLGWVIFYQPHLLGFHVFELWHGGMSFHGALVMGVAYTYVFSKVYHISALCMMDHIAFFIPVPLGIVRVANFINGEIWGRVTESKFGVLFEHADTQLRHPSQLYEAFGEGLLLFCVLYTIRPYCKRNGQLTGYAMVLYATIRLFIEVLYREPSFEWSVYISTGQLLCVMMLFFGICLMRLTKQPQ